MGSEMCIRDSAVTSSAPTICTILTTIAAVIILKYSLMARTGKPCTLAAMGSIDIDSKLWYRNSIDKYPTTHIVTMMSKLFGSTNNKSPYKYPSTIADAVPPQIRIITKPKPSIPVMKIAIAASPSNIPRACNSSIKTAATVQKAKAYNRGPIPPKTSPMAIAPNDTCANPSPIKARFLINKKVPRKPATMATIIEAIKGR